jgi:hypothetical protein
MNAASLRASTAVLALLPLVAACGSTRGSSFDQENEAGAGVIDASTTGDSQPVGPLGEAAPPPGNGCSADLHSVLSGDGGGDLFSSTRN